MIMAPSTCTKLLAYLLVLALSMTLTLSHPFHPKAKRQGTQCDTNASVSSICYECAKSHFDMFDTVYSSCCDSEPQGVMRVYCGEIYTEPPKRNKMWKQPDTPGFF